MRSPRLTFLGRTAAVAAAASLAVTACTDDGEPRSSGDPSTSTDDVAVFSGLRGAPVALFAERDCDAVLDDLQARAPEVMIDQNFGWFGPGMGRDVMAMDDAMEDVGGAVEESADFDASTTAAAAPAADGEAAGSGGDDGFSTTNTQEAGIDEPDVVENDGEHVYVVDQDRLVILDADDASVVSTTPLGNWGAQLLLQGDRLLVLGQGGEAVYDDEMAVADVVFGDDVEVLPTDDAVRPGFYAGTTVSLYDVSDPTAPALVERTDIEGNHVSTRVVGGVARVVVTSYPEWHTMIEPAAFDDVAIALEQSFADIDPGDDGAVDAAFTAAAAAVAPAFADTTIGDWLPQFRTSTPDGTSIEGQLVECEDVLIPEVNAGMSETSVLRFDFDGGFDPTETTTIVGEAGTIYASTSTLYVAANQFVPARAQTEAIAAQDGYATAIHAFDLTGEGAATLAGSGVVPGHILNQFSLSEHAGHLRVATTEGSPWGPGDPSSSGVRILRNVPGGDGDLGVLTEVGSVTGLGVTETIQSVRFLGDVGYVVTFRQTDPLYVIDLADPENPRALGELKIPGFSSYLHPAEPGRLIGIGRDADLEGRDQGLLISLFDVSDPTDPRQLQTWTERDAWSAAGFDSKAFLYWAPESSIAIPIERYGNPVRPVPLPQPEPQPEPIPVEPDGGPGDAEPAEGEQSAGSPPAEEPQVFEIDGDGDEVEPDQPPAQEEPDVFVEEPYLEEFSSGIATFSIDDGGIDERGFVQVEGRWPSRAIVVDGELWSLFEGGVAVSDFDATDVRFVAYT